MSQLRFFQTFGPVMVATLKDEQLAMRVVSKAWMNHKHRTHPAKSA